MREWHVPPDEINRKWTPRLLHRMLDARNKHFARLTRELNSEPDDSSQTPNRVANDKFFSRIRYCRTKGGSGHVPEPKLKAN